MSHADDESRPLVMERIGKMSETGRKFDIEFWQRQGSTAIFAAAWEMVVEAYRGKESELAFQKSVERIGSMRRTSDDPTSGS